MKKNILVLFPTIDRGTYFVNDILLPVCDLKRKAGNYFENENVRITVASVDTQSIRGMSPDFIFMSDDYNINDYNNALHFVRGDHSKIQVVD